MKAYLKLHLAVALFGLAGIFGRWIQLDPLFIVWGRVSFASIAFLPFILRKSRAYAIPNFAFIRNSLWLGLLLAFHWFSFFKAIQETSIALALLSFASFPFFTLLLEGMLFRKALRRMDWILVFVSFMGTSLIVPWDVEAPGFIGIIWGLLSGLSFALLAILNRKLVKGHDAIEVAFYQDLFACLLLSPFVFKDLNQASLLDWQLLILLGTVFTALSHSLFIDSLKHIRARTAALIAALEPVYGIIAGLVLFAEMPSLITILGGTIILGAGLWAQRVGA